MSHSEQIESKADRRTGRDDRRVCEERRCEERLSHMKADCRKNLLRRDSDVEDRMIEGELWWSSSQQFI